MKYRTIRSVEKALEDAFDRYQAEVDKIAATVRRENVVPALRAADAGMIAGNGTWYIQEAGTGKGHRFHHMQYNGREAKLPLGVRMMMLSVPGLDRNDLGSLMDDVK